MTDKLDSLGRPRGSRDLKRKTRVECAVCGGEFSVRSPDPDCRLPTNHNARRGDGVCRGVWRAGALVVAVALLLVLLSGCTSTTQVGLETLVQTYREQIAAAPCDCAEMTYAEDSTRARHRAIIASPIEIGRDRGEAAGTVLWFRHEPADGCHLAGVS